MGERFNDRSSNERSNRSDGRQEGQTTRTARERLHQYLATSTLPGEEEEGYMQSPPMTKQSHSTTTQTPSLSGPELPVQHSSVASALDKYRTAAMDAEVELEAMSMAREADQFGLELRQSRLDDEEKLLERQLGELDVARSRLGHQHRALRKQRVESRESLRERKRKLDERRGRLERRRMEALEKVGSVSVMSGGGHRMAQTKKTKKKWVGVGE
jgi:hypothetical protein